MTNKPTISVARADTGTMEAAIHSLEGIFEALLWIDDRYLEGHVDPDRIKETRALLITAGLTITEQTSERF